MEELLVSFNILKIGITFTAVYLFFKLIGVTIMKNKTGEGWIALFKAVFYSGLAFFIYQFYDIQNLNKVPAVNALTFGLCCFEGASNLVVWLKSIKDFFKPITMIFHDK